MSKSGVWRHFKRTGVKLAATQLTVFQPNTFRCPQNTTTPLWKQFEKERKDMGSKLGKLKPGHSVTKSKSVVRQPTIMDVIAKKIPYGRDHPKQNLFDENLKNQIINDCLPFRFAESESLRKMVSDLDPRIMLSRAVRKRILKTKRTPVL